MKFRPPVARLFHEEGNTDRHGQADTRSRYFAKSPKTIISILLLLLLNIFYKFL